MESRQKNNVRSIGKSKEEKKVLRKQTKASHTLLKHEGIVTASQPTKVKYENQEELRVVSRKRVLANIVLILTFSF